MHQIICLMAVFMMCYWYGKSKEPDLQSTGWQVFTKTAVVISLLIAVINVKYLM